MQKRQVNLLRHELSARQALAMLIEFWRESRLMPIILITAPGESMRYASTIRVALSKEKAKIVDGKRRVTYGFNLSESFAYTDEVVRGEAVVIRWKYQRAHIFRNVFKELLDQKGVRT